MQLPGIQLKASGCEAQPSPRPVSLLPSESPLSPLSLPAQAVYPVLSPPPHGITTHQEANNSSDDPSCLKHPASNCPCASQLFGQRSLELLRGGAGSFTSGTGRVTWTDLSRLVNLWAQLVPTSPNPDIPFLGFYVIPSSLVLFPILCSSPSSHTLHPNPSQHPHLFPIVLPPSPCSSSSLPPQSSCSCPPFSLPFSLLLLLPPVARLQFPRQPAEGTPSPASPLRCALASCEVRWEEAAARGRRAPGTVRAGGWFSRRVPGVRVPPHRSRGLEPPKTLRRRGWLSLRDDKARDPFARSTLRSSPGPAFCLGAPAGRALR